MRFWKDVLRSTKETSLLIILGVLAASTVDGMTGKMDKWAVLAVFLSVGPFVVWDELRRE